MRIRLTPTEDKFGWHDYMVYLPEVFTHCDTDVKELIAFQKIERRAKWYHTIDEWRWQYRW